MPIYRIADINVVLCPKTKVFAQMLEDWQTDSQTIDLRLPPFPPDREITASLEQLSQEILYHYDGMYLHAGALLYKERVYLFTAPSGTGKSTHLSLWKQYLKDKVRILNGDKPLLRRHREGITVYGTPWKGKERWGENLSGPLGGIFILRRGNDNRITPLTPDQALTSLISATVYPEDAAGKNKLFDFLEQMLAQIPVAALQCRPDTDAVKTVLSYIENEKR